VKNIKTAYILLCIAVGIMLNSCAYPVRSEDNRISVVCTAFAQYDWVKHIVEGREDVFEIIYLNDNGVDMHSFQPDASDIVSLCDSELVISIGGYSESWIDKAVENSGNKNIRQLKLIELLGEEVLFTDSCDEENEHDHEHISVVDEHVWLSLKNAVFFCNAIAEVICELDPENEDYYESNVKSYTDKLCELDRISADFISTAPRDTIIVADRFPLRYLVRDYSIKYCAAFDSCSSDSEASFETLALLAEKIEQNRAKVIFVTETSDKRIARALAEPYGDEIKIFELESMQAVSSKEIEKGMSYLDVMQNNLALIHGALIV